MSKKSTSSAAPGAKLTEALALVRDFGEEVRDLTSMLKYKADFPKVNAIMAGLGPILQDGAGSEDPDYVEFSAEQVVALLAMLDEAIPAAAKADPLFQDVQRSVAKIRSLVSGYLPPADAAIAPPAASSQAGEASENEDADRIEIARAAACEIDELARIVSEEIDGSEGAAALMSILRRVRRLACISISALSDRVDTVPTIRARLEESGASHA